MSTLRLDINLDHHDDLYQMLVDLHEGRTDEESRKINAKLILILMNQVGDEKIIKEALKLARISSVRLNL